MSDRAFERLYLARHPEPKRCEVQTASLNRPVERCSNSAKYAVTFGVTQRVGYVCDTCLSSWAHELTRTGPIVVERLVA